MGGAVLPCHIFQLCQGVSILLNKSLLCQVEHVIIDPKGHYIIFLLVIGDQLFAFVNVYVPPQFLASILYRIYDKLAQFLASRVIIVGDFNAILDRELDAFNPTRVLDTDLSYRALALQLTEIWRWRNPQVTQFSHFSAVHHSGSRIDLFLSNYYLTSHCYWHLICQQGSQTILRLRSSCGSGGGCWRLATCWPNIDKVAENVRGKIAQYWEFMRVGLPHWLLGTPLRLLFVVTMYLPSSLPGWSIVPNWRIWNLK